MSFENRQQIENQPTQNESQEVLDIQKIKESYGDLNDGFDVFENYLNSLSEEEKKQILEVFNGEDFDSVSMYIMENGFPNNQTISEFRNEFGIESTQETIESTQETIESTQEELDDTQEKLDDTQESLLQTYYDIQGISSDNKEFNELKNRLSLLKGIKPGDKEYVENLTKAIFDVTGYLKGLNQEQFRDILNIIKKYDDNLYNSFKDTLILFDSSFKPAFNSFENSLIETSEDIVILPDAQYLAVKAITGDIGYGETIGEMDDSKRPPERFLSNGDYRLETPLGVRDFYEATVVYERAKADLDKRKGEILETGNRKYNTLVEKQETLKDLENSEVKDEEYISELKREIEQIKVEIESLRVEFAELQDKYKEIEAQYRENLANEIENYRNTIREQDRDSLETLDFIHSIGFDKIPQGDTDNLIAQMNAGIDINRAEIDLGAGFSLNTDIDLSRGILGFSDGIDGTSAKEREVFVRFFNKMLTGDPTKPVNPIEAITNENFQVNDTLIQTYRAELYKGGVFNINKALDNLKTKTEV